MNHSSPDLTNRQIAGYTVLHRLGVGGMSEVYLAFQESLHRHVALKVMRSDYVGSEDHEKRFLQEARAVASIMHPNIVQVYDVGKFESVHYIAQEYVPGSNLHAYIQRRGALPVAECLSILWQAASALQKAATIGVVHRDIKPDNLLLTPDGDVKITDFGLARANGQELHLTAVGVALGTPLYMSPEQVQGHRVDSRSDLYSLGATAYHMLVGRPPFTGETPIALAMQHVQAMPLPICDLRPDAPESLVAIVHKLLQKSPQDRFADASQLTDALHRVIEEELGENVNKKVPFSELVIEHHKVSNLAVTQQLQQLTDARSDLKQPSSASIRSLSAGGLSKSKLARFAACSIAALIPMAAVFGLTYRDVLMTQIGDRELTKEESVEKQYAQALLANDLPHWQAVSNYFPADKDPVNERYYYKSLLQIARLNLDARDYPAAKLALDKILKSTSGQMDNVILTIANIEMWFLLRTEGGDNDNTQRIYRTADSLLASMEDQPEKLNLVLKALPNYVRIAWDKIKAT